MAAIRVSAPDGATFALCPCGCQTSFSASQWYYGFAKCPRGNSTPKEWLETFQKKEIPAKVKSAPKKKKSSDDSSKASTPTKDGENADNTSPDAASKEDKEKKPASNKKQKVEKEPKTPKETKKAKADEEEAGEAKLKKPASAYFLFCEAKRAEAKEADASKKLGAKELGEMWKELPEADKEPYNSKAAALKAEYDEKKPLSEAEKKKAAKAEGPAKARSPYILFTMDVRAKIVEEFPGIQAKEVLKIMGSRWKELSAEDKKVYEDKAKAEKDALTGGKGCGDKLDASGTKRKSTEDQGQAEDSNARSEEEEEKADQEEETGDLEEKGVTENEQMQEESGPEESTETEKVEEEDGPQEATEEEKGDQEMTSQADPEGEE